MSKIIGNIVIFLLVISMISNGAIDVQKAISTVVALFKTAVQAIPTDQQQYNIPPTANRNPAGQQRPRR
jgi:hypothetical protein